MLVDPRNGPDFDLPADPGARLYVIASTPRTGSTLLARTLWDTGRVGAPKEYLNPTQVRDWEVRLGNPESRLLHRALRGPAVALAGRGAWSDARLRQHLRRVRERRSSGGWFGLKLHHHHLEQWFLRPGRDVDAWLPAAIWIRMRREDRLGQALSWVRARQTGAWAAHRRGWSVPVYRRSAIQRTMDEISRHEAAWDAFLAGREVHDVTYEALARRFEPTVQGVLEALGVQDARVPAAPLEPQADALTIAWRRRFLEGAAP